MTEKTLLCVLVRIVFLLVLSLAQESDPAQNPAAIESYGDVLCENQIACDNQSHGYEKQCCEKSNCCFYQDHLDTDAATGKRDCRRCSGEDQVCCPLQYCCVSSLATNINQVAAVCGAVVAVCCILCAASFYFGCLCKKNQANDEPTQLDATYSRLGGISNNTTADFASIRAHEALLMTENEAAVIAAEKAAEVAAK